MQFTLDSTKDDDAQFPSRSLVCVSLVDKRKTTVEMHIICFTVLRYNCALNDRLWLFM